VHADRHDKGLTSELLKECRIPSVQFVALVSGLRTRPPAKRSLAMTQYLISFPGDAMDHIPEQDMAEVARAAHAVIDEAKRAGVYLCAGGLDEDVEPVMVAGDGTVTAGTYRQTKEQWGGLTIIEVSTREAAIEWAAKIAAACRCAQEVREFMHDPLI
jgi:hypothetical protein